MSAALKLGLSLLAFSLAACSQDMDELERYIDEVNARPARPLEPIPEVSPYESVDYAGNDLRDPFVANEIFNPEEDAEQQIAGDGPKPIAGRLKEPLEAFPLDSLRMVGTIKIGATQYALLRSNEPFVYRVKAGDYVGQNHGRVIDINPSDLKLTELFADGAGRWVQRETRLELSNTSAAAVGQ